MMFSILTDNRHGHHPIRRAILQTIVLTATAGLTLAISDAVFRVRMAW